jgi:ribosomal protein L29
MAAPKKTTKVAASKQVKKAVEVKSLEVLKNELAQKRQDMIDSRRSHRAGELVNPRVLGTIKKEIARLSTAIRAEELKSLKGSK